MTAEVIFAGGAKPPTPTELAGALGRAGALWDELKRRIAAAHAPIDEEWVSSGKNHPWALRLKQRKRAVAYLTPPAGIFKVNTTRLLTLISIVALTGGCATTPRESSPPSPVFDVAALDLIPVARSMAPPLFPSNLREPGITGSAVIAFVVDSSGDVRDPRVVQATRPEFGIAAMEAVSQWKFRPGQKGGRNVAVRMSVPVEFQIAETGPAPAGVGPASQAVFEMAALDQIPVPRFMAKPIYPLNFQEKGVSGRAVIGFIVDTNGDVRDPWIMEATHQEFGLAAAQAVSRWKFRPGQKGGRNVNVRMKVPIIFNIAADTPAADPPKDTGPRPTASTHLSGP